MFIFIFNIYLSPSRTSQLCAMQAGGVRQANRQRLGHSASSSMLRLKASEDGLVKETPFTFVKLTRITTCKIHTRIHTHTQTLPLSQCAVVRIYAMRACICDVFEKAVTK